MVGIHIVQCTGLVSTLLGYINTVYQTVHLKQRCALYTLRNLCSVYSRVGNTREQEKGLAGTRWVVLQRGFYTL